ncbi:MAG: hypothetical protein ACYDB7_03875 [Mycobacteriales bacterium]
MLAGGAWYFGIAVAVTLVSLQFNAAAAAACAAYGLGAIACPVLIGVYLARFRRQRPGLLLR